MSILRPAVSPVERDVPWHHLHPIAGKASINDALRIGCMGSLEPVLSDGIGNAYYEMPCPAHNGTGTLHWESSYPTSGTCDCTGKRYTWYPVSLLAVITRSSLEDALERLVWCLAVEKGEITEPGQGLPGWTPRQ